jgi:hypothetical protein
MQVFQNGGINAVADLSVGKASACFDGRAIVPEFEKLFWGGERSL